MFSFAREGELTGKHLEGHQRQGVLVALTAQRLASELLGAHVIGRAKDEACLGYLLPVARHCLGDSEVHDLDQVAAIARATDHDILGLEIPVNDA
jgi:hypothetical protein